MHFERFSSSNVISRKKIRTSLKNLRRKVAKEQNSPFIFNVAAAAAFLSQVQGL